jgi:CHAT domain-containing protein
MCLIGEQKFDQAEALAKEIIAAMQEQHRGVNEAQTGVMLASLYRKQKRPDQALEQLERAVAIARPGDYRIALADAEAALADICTSQGDLSRAETYAKQSLVTTRSSGVLSDLPNRMQELADVEAKQGKYGAADVLYSQAADLVDAQILSAPISARPLLLKAMSDLYTHYFALLALDKPDVLEEYAVVERVRGRSIASLLHFGIPPDSAEAAAVEKEISSLRLKLAHADSQAEIAQLRQQIFFTEHKRWLDRSELTVVRRPDHILPITAVQRALSPQELLLEYVQTPDRMYVLVISDKDLRCVSLPGTAAEITTLSDRFVTAIKRRTAASDEGRELWNTILGPVPEVRTHSNLIIIPDGELYTVPFAALVEPNGTRLVDSHTITRTPSASIYVLLHNRPSDRVKGGLLSVGGVAYSADVQKIAKLRGYDGGALFNLPASEDEVKAAVGALGSQMNHVELEDTRATETAFKDSGLSTFSTIHLAVHGIADSTAAEKAALVFLPDATHEEDGILEIPEIVRLRLHSDLVVLSACETAIGVVQGEDGVSDLSRSFLLAGSRSVVATLWRVDETFSAVLMKHFYEELAVGHSISEALTNAQRAILREYRQSAVPFFWAGFITEGSGNVTLGSVVNGHAAARNAMPADRGGMPQYSRPLAAH